jgi:hypothetical protein
MSFKKILSLRMWNRIARTQRNIQKMMVKKADALHLCLLSINMMCVIRDHEKFAIANIVPDIRPMVGQLYDYALLYLDLPATGMPTGFYRLQLSQDRDEAMQPQGILTDESGQFVRNIRYYGVDVFAPILGAKNIPASRLTLFETFASTNDRHVIGGTHADGKGFLIVL